MGIFNTFRSLDQEGVAQKLYNFQMKVMRDAAQRGRFTDERHVEVLKGGICTGYTLLWLREQWRADEAFKFIRDIRDGKYTGDSRIGETGGGVGMLGVRLRTLFEMNVKSPKDVPMALEAIGRAVGLDLDVSYTEEHANLADALEALADTTAAGTYYVETYMKIHNEETSHAIGVNTTRDGKLHVFDANCGEYLLESPTNFSIHLTEVYRQSRKAKFQECLVTKVSGGSTMA